MWQGVTKLTKYPLFVPSLDVCSGNSFKEHFEHQGLPDIVCVCKDLLQMNLEDQMLPKEALEVLGALFG